MLHKFIYNIIVMVNIICNVFAATGGSSPDSPTRLEEHLSFKGKVSQGVSDVSMDINDFFQGRLSDEEITRLNSTKLLGLIIAHIEPEDHSTQRAEYASIAKALQRKGVISLKTERTTVKYSEDYSITYDKIIGYELRDVRNSSKALHDYFVKYYNDNIRSSDEGASGDLGADTYHFN